MEEIISKGYATEAKINSPDRRTWYLPHHGVYHPHKPSKLRLMSDCNAELNGLNLVNKFVGFLTKFRKNKVAFMADIGKNVFSNICC